MARIPTPNNTQIYLTDGRKGVPLEALPPEAWTFLVGDDLDVGDLKAVMKAVPWLGRGVRLLAQGVAGVPFDILQGDQVVDSSENYTGAVGWLGDPFTLLHQVEADLTIHARSYVLKERNLLGRQLNVRRLYPPTIRDRVDGERGLFGFIRTINGKQMPPLDLQDMVYFRLPDYWSELGKAVSPAQNALAAGTVLKYMDDFIGAHMKRGAVKITLLAVSGDASPQQRQELETWWQRVMGGIANAFRGRVVNADRVTATPIGEGLEELSNQTLSKEKREDVSTALGIPQSILFSTGAVNRAVSQQDDVNFHTKTLIPDARYIERVLNHQLLQPEGYRLQFKPQEMTIFQADEEARSLALFNLVQAGETLDNAYEILGFDIPEEMAAKREMALAAGFQGQPNGKAAVLERHLEQWRRKSINALKAGREAQVKFESDVISGTMASSITSMLGSARTREDVHDVFDHLLLDPEVVWARYP